MLLKHDSQWNDFDIGWLKELLGVVDAQLFKHKQEIQKSPDPAGFRLFDAVERTTQRGFVAGRWYLSKTYGWLKADKFDSSKFGLSHPCKLTITNIINLGANYCKHREEWSFGKKDQKAAPTITAISTLMTLCKIT